jgi:molecular chaperone GrpE (heat shock protein)
MSNLRQAAQRALKEMDDHMYRADTHEFYEAKEALRAALAEPDSDYERGFVDGMNLQTKGSVDKAVNRMAEPEQEPFMVVAPECAERGCMAHDDRVDGSGIVVQLRKEQEEVRRLHAELERKSDAIQRLWKERDELRAVLTKIVGSK